MFFFSTIKKTICFWNSTVIKPVTNKVFFWETYLCVPPYISSSYKNVIKNKMTGRVDILRCIIEKNAKTSDNLKSQDRKNFSFWSIPPKTAKTVLFWILWLKFLLLLHFCSKMRISTLPVILSYMNFFVARTFFYLYKGLANLHICR